jgi:hypothetical protein
MNKYDAQEFDVQMKVFTEWLMKRIINAVTNAPQEFKHTPSKYKTYDGGKTWHETKKKH